MTTIFPNTLEFPMLVLIIQPLSSETEIIQPLACLKGEHHAEEEDAEGA
jgi:hypothetical protein